MTPSVETIIPFLEGCAHRQKALEYVLPRYHWPVRLAYGSHPWVKANAVNPAVAKSRADVLVIADADCWAQDVSGAVKAVLDGEAWAVPHSSVVRLAESALEGFSQGQPWHSLPHAEPVRQGVRGGGIVVARKDVLLDVPLDPRFNGWGQEDSSWGYALATLYGEPWRGDAPLIHLWHPPQERLDRKWGSLESRRLDRRYYAARRDPKAMRSILSEFKETP
jgi:hypothetical protein